MFKSFTFQSCLLAIMCAVSSYNAMSQHFTPPYVAAQI